MKAISKLVMITVFISIPLVASADRGRNAGAAEAFQRVSTYLPRKHQTANVFDAIAIGQGQIRYLGAATLTRSKNGIQGRIMTVVPSAGDPYTLWGVIFNNPAACATTPCQDTDLGNPAVKGAVYNLSGAVSASDGEESGTVNLDFNISAGKLPNGVFELVPGPYNNGLLRNQGFKAEVHLVVDHHPTILPGGDSWIADLTTTNIPGMGPATSIAAAIFLACPGTSCPETAL